MKCCGTIVCFGGSMSNCINQNSELNKLFDTYEEIEDGVYIGTKRDSFIKIVATKCGRAGFMKKISFLKDSPIVGIGFTGSINDSLMPSNLILPTSCSSEYFGINNLLIMSDSFSSKLKDYLYTNSNKIYLCKVYTVNSLESETPELIKNLISEGFDCIDMELYFFSKYLEKEKIPYSAMLVVSDNLFTNPLDLKNKGGDLPLEKQTRQIIKSLFKNIINFLFLTN